MQKKVAAITFDDGPCPDLDNVLISLASFDCQATFFWNGAPTDADLRRVRAHGCEVGSHGKRHLHPSQFQDRELRNDLRWSGAACGSPNIYRPPYGEEPTRMARLAAQVGMMNTILWDVDSRDYKLEPGAVVTRVLDLVKPGSIILCHEEHAMAYLMRVLRALTKSGYRLVTVSQLLLLSDQQPPNEE